jgi:5-methylcytosine-specific restriction endonuclease McrA
LLGYSLPELREHLERQFVRGMSWEKIGDWHIDHILPLSSFTATSADDPEVRRAWALTNLRPLWAKENMQKSDSRAFLI